MLQVNHDLEQDEQKLHHQVGSSIGNSPASNWPKHGSPMELNSLQHFNRLSGFSPSSSSPGTNLPGLASVLQPPVPSGKVALAGKDYLRDGHLGHIFTNRNPNRIGDYALPLSFPEQKSDQYTFNRANTKPPSSQQFLWGSPEFTNSFSLRAQAIRHHVVPSGDGFPLSNNGSFPHPSQFQQLHHVGSAPSGFPFERRIGFYEYSPRTSYIGPFEGMGTSDGDWSFPINMGPHGSLKPSAVSRKMESGSDFPISGSKLSPVLQDNVNFPGVLSSKFESFLERGRSWHFESKGINSDGVKQFQLDLDKIRSGEDTRTTLMIKNIPNKYTSKMLLATIDEHHRGTYDFLYLPIDFKNKCNVGYAFINMLSPSHIIPFYEAFSGKKWEKFNSEKVASLAYARIQGRSALVSHFQNSSLMNEDKRCKPILIDAESQELIDQENFPSSSSRIQVGQSNGANVMKTSSSQL